MTVPRSVTYRLNVRDVHVKDLSVCAVCEANPEGLSANSH